MSVRGAGAEFGEMMQGGGGGGRGRIRGLDLEAAIEVGTHSDTLMLDAHKKEGLPGELEIAEMATVQSNWWSEGRSTWTTTGCTVYNVHTLKNRSLIDQYLLPVSDTVPH